MTDAVSMKTLDLSKLTREQLLELGAHNALFNASHMFEMAGHKTLDLREKKVLAKVARTLMAQAMGFGRKLADDLKKTDPAAVDSARVVHREPETKQ